MSIGKKAAIWSGHRCTPLINYLVTLRETTLTGRKTMLCNITRRQLRAISVVVTSLLSGRINPLRRDSTFLKG